MNCPDFWGFRILLKSSMFRYMNSTELCVKAQECQLWSLVAWVYQYSVGTGSWERAQSQLGLTAPTCGAVTGSSHLGYSVPTPHEISGAVVPDDQWPRVQRANTSRTKVTNMVKSKLH